MKNLTFLIITLILVSCNQGGPSSDLTLIPRDKIIERLKAGDFDYRNAKFMTQSGRELNEEEQQKLNNGELGKDYYEDSNGTIKEIIVRPIELEDKLVEIQRRELAIDPLRDIEIIDINCDSLDTIYKEVYNSNQEVRKARGDVDGVDKKNIQTVISAISKCGWAEKHTQTVWMVFQHSSLGVMAYYYPELKALSEKGNLSKSSFAMLQDRLLMEHGYKQLYGTQIINGRLYKLEDPANVNSRRTGIGMGVIEDYLKVWGLEFEAEVERLQKEEQGK